MSFYNAAQEGFLFATVPHAVAANDVLVLKSVSVPKGSLGQLNISGVIFHLEPGSLVPLPDIIVTGGVTVDVENLDGTTMVGARVLGYESTVQIDETVNTNTLNAVTASMEINEARLFAVQAIGLTGTHATHTVGFEISNNDTDWVTGPALTLTGEGIATANTPARYIRAKVTLAEGAASTSRIIVHAKN